MDARKKYDVSSATGLWNKLNYIVNFINWWVSLKKLLDIRNEFISFKFEVLFMGFG